MDHFGIDDDIARRLEDLSHVVVDRRQIRVSATFVATPDDASVADVHIPVALLEAGVEATRRQVRCDALLFFLGGKLAFDSRRDSAVGRIDNERRPLVGCQPHPIRVHPRVVVRARDVRLRTSIPSIAIESVREVRLKLLGFLV
jgi:hypothetical protein